jgi:hypothetical protein
MERRDGTRAVRYEAYEESDLDTWHSAKSAITFALFLVSAAWGIKVGFVFGYRTLQATISGFD